MLNLQVQSKLLLCDLSAVKAQYQHLADEHKTLSNFIRDLGHMITDYTDLLLDDESDIIGVTEQHIVPPAELPTEPPAELPTEPPTEPPAELPTEPPTELPAAYYFATEQLPYLVIEPAPAHAPAYITALKEYVYHSDSKFNGDAFHLAENVLDYNINTCSDNELVMILNMCRIIKTTGKKGKFTMKDKQNILACKYPVATSTELKKLIKGIETKLTNQHGKYSNQQKLNSIKVSTNAVYTDSWLKRISSFTANLPVLTLDNNNPLDIFLGNT